MQANKTRNQTSAHTSAPQLGPNLEGKPSNNHSRKGPLEPKHLRNNEQSPLGVGWMGSPGVCPMMDFTDNSPGVKYFAITTTEHPINSEHSTK
eukprot:479996-Amphidinium_carterae.4